MNFQGHLGIRFSLYIYTTDRKISTFNFNYIVMLPQDDKYKIMYKKVFHLK